MAAGTDSRWSRILRRLGLEIGPIVPPTNPPENEGGEREEPPMAETAVKKTQNLWQGILISLVIACFVFFFAYGIFVFLTGYRFTSTGVGIILAIISLVYFLYGGIRAVPVGYLAAPLFLGKRVWSFVLDEGWTWYWPSPIGDINQNDVRKRSLDVPVAEVLTKDKIAVKIDFSAEVEIVDVSRYLGVDKPDELFSKAVNGGVRLIAAKIQAENIADARIPILQLLQNGKSTGKKVVDLEHLLEDQDKIELEALELIGLTPHARSQWGIKIITARLGSVRLPEEIEAASANILVEKKQAAAEEIEARNVDNLIKIYQGSDDQDKLSRLEALKAAQFERNKRIGIDISGNASDLVKAGAAAGGIVPKNQG